MKNQKGFVAIVVGLVIGVILLVGGYIYRNGIISTNPTTNDAIDGNNTFVSQEPKNGWQLYQNQSYRLSLNYPAGWIVKDNLTSEFNPTLSFNKESGSYDTTESATISIFPSDLYSTDEEQKFLNFVNKNPEPYSVGQWIGYQSVFPWQGSGVDQRIILHRLWKDGLTLTVVWNYGTLIDDPNKRVIATEKYLLPFLSSVEPLPGQFDKNIISSLQHYKALPHCDVVADKIPQSEVDAAISALLPKNDKILETVMRDDNAWGDIIAKTSLRIGCNAKYTTRLRNEEAESRDRLRLEDIQKIIQPMLELYFEDHQTYPVVNQIMNPVRGCLSASGFVPACPKNPQSMTNSPNSGLPYLPTMPENRTPGGTPYTYISTDDKDNVCMSAPCSNYRITFSLEKQSDQLTPGMHAATKKGIK